MQMLNSSWRVILHIIAGENNSPNKGHNGLRKKNKFKKEERNSGTEG